MAARAGAVTVGPAGPQARTISPVVSSGVARLVLTVVYVLLIVERKESANPSWVMAYPPVGLTRQGEAQSCFCWS